MAWSTHRACERCGRACRGRHCGPDCSRAAGRDDRARRGNSSERGYGQGWRAFRRRHLERFPFCADCGATGHLAVHHLVAVADAPELRLDPGNVVTLCDQCHLRRHRAVSASLR